jgi:hypothetical protein
MYLAQWSTTPPLLPEYVFGWTLSHHFIVLTSDEISLKVETFGCPGYAA